MIGDSLDRLHPKNLRRLHRELRGFVRARLWLQVLVAMGAGLGAGWTLGPGAGLVEPAAAQVITGWLALPGTLFLALIQMIVIPLVIASIVLGMAAGDSAEALKRTGLGVVGFFLATTLAAVLIGLAVALLLRPGDYVDSALLVGLDGGAATELVGPSPGAEPAPAERPAAAPPGLAELPTRLVELVPSNPLRAGLEQNMTQVVLFALLLGLALLAVPSRSARLLVDLLGAVQEVTMVVVRWAMLLVPFAVFGLLAQITSRLGLEAILGVGAYVGCVLLGLLFVMGLYLAIYGLFLRRSPLAFLGATREVLLLAFSTSSSAAVMPTSIRTAEARLGVPSATANFIIPLGTTLNMAGTALYQVVATIFLAQVYQVEVGLPALLLVVVLAVGASVGSPGTPGIGIVILAMLLGSVGIPASGIALVIGVDRILDMSRTSVNVAGDLVAAAVLGERARQAQTAEDSAAEKPAVQGHTDPERAPGEPSSA